MELKIVNARLVHESDYPYDFHTFFHERTVDLFLLLPGINFESIHIQVSVPPKSSNLQPNQKITITANIERKYRQIFKKTQISISGNVPVKVRHNALTTLYRNGILKIELPRIL